jgi:hypothetical protein
MKKRVLFTLAALTTFSTLNAQLDMPYATGFDNTAEQSGWQQFQKGAVSGFEEWNYEASNAYSAPNALVHMYPVGGQDPTDNWFVSPAFNISAGGSLDSMRYYFSGFGTPQAGDTVGVYLLQGNADPDLATSAMMLHQFTGANYQNDYTWRLLAPIALSAQAGNSYLAIRYKTINNWLDVRFDNIAISRISLAGISETALADILVYPNPVSNQQVQVQFDAAQFQGSTLDLVLYNASGQRVRSVAVTSNMPVSLSLAPGFYAYQLQDASAAPVAIGKLVVQ